mgnify:CR=1 FL=1
MEKKLKRGTLCVQGGWKPKNGEPRVVPIVQSTTFKYDDSEEMAKLFDLEATGYFYTRLQNPTNDAVAQKIADLEGGVGATLTSSGQAANFYAIFNICEAGDHVVTSNEIYGGTYNLFGVTLKKLGIECTFVNPDAPEDEIQKAFRPNTKAVVCTHASNLTGNMLDIARIGAMAHAHGALLVVDASQTAGAAPIDMQKMGIDVLCFTGHKGLMGPQGTGGLCIRPGVELRPLLRGGTGVHSYDREQPQEYPTRLEAGTLNGHGLAGLHAALDFILRQGAESIGARERQLMRRFYEGVRGIPGVTVYGDFTAPERAAIVTLNIRDYDSAEIADILAEDYGIATRAGAHCAPRMHEALGTVQQGAVRFSFSFFNTEEEADAAVSAVRELAEE